MSQIKYCMQNFLDQLHASFVLLLFQQEEFLFKDCLYAVMALTELHISNCLYWHPGQCFTSAEPKTFQHGWVLPRLLQGKIPTILCLVILWRKSQCCCQQIMICSLALCLVVSGSLLSHSVWFQKDQWQSCLFTRHPGLKGPNQRNTMGPADRNCAHK